eukprot:CAMPEP_0180309774 /NCGR_PEP_ID=MMETSP0988-20121125/29301_1 /TAXON_ID=697907 /ORGANISM="non described non described, Strain CCMP2293" /LENGTH=261 /DNA_ID=CAMNT_0022293621 /DNA_START=108 /DNA_END=890 /DNA_ORIENTATION=+
MGMGSQSHAPEQYSHTPAIQQPAICNSGEGGAMHMRGGGCFGFGVRQFIDTRRVPAPVRWPEPPESERAAPRARRRIAPPTDGIVRRVPGPLRIPGQLEIGTMVEIKGLRAAKEYNGLRGEVVQFRKGRYSVQMKDFEDEMLLKRENLIVVSTPKKKGTDAEAAMDEHAAEHEKPVEQEEKKEEPKVMTANLKRMVLHLFPKGKGGPGEAVAGRIRAALAGAGVYDMEGLQGCAVRTLVTHGIQPSEAAALSAASIDPQWL